MADRTKIEVALAGSTDLALVEEFYSNVGYGGGLGAADRVLVGRQEESIVAAAKLSPEGDTLVLRGMYVSEPLRGVGVGATLLERVSDEIGSSRCWCVPYSHLRRFYSNIGFTVIPDGEAPGFLLSRRERYRSSGHDVIVMCRPKDWVSDAD